MSNDLGSELRECGTLLSGFFALYLAASMGVFAVLFVPVDSSTLGLGSTRTFVAAWALLYVATGVLYVTQRLRIGRVDGILIAACSVLMLSALWSARPRHSVVYGGTILLNLLFVAQLTRFINADALARLILKTILICAVLGLVGFIIGIDGTRYIDTHDRTTIWGTTPMRGIFNHKITAGYYSAIGMTLSLGLLRGPTRVASVVFLGVFNLLTGSATGMAAAAVGVSAFFVVRWAAKRRLAPGGFIVLLATGVAVAGIGAVLLLPRILPLLGRDPTLTGRTLLWAWGWTAGWERPFVGWGFFGYMGSEEAIAFARATRAFMAYEVPHFHNAYIQAFVELGLTGVVAYLSVLVFAFHRLYQLTLLRNDAAAASLAAVTMLIAFSAMFMNLFFKHNDFTTMLLAFAIVVAPAATGLAKCRTVPPARRRPRGGTRIAEA